MEQNGSIKNFSYIGLGRVATIMLQAIFYLLFAALLDPELYGKLNVILALASTFSIISLSGLNLTLQVQQAKNNFKLSEQIITLFVILTSVAGLILLSIDKLAALLCVGLSFFAMYQANLVGLKLYKKFMLNSIIKSALIIIIPISLYFVLEIPGIVLGMAISNIVASIPFFRFVKIKSFYELKNHYKMILHNCGVSASTYLPYTVDKLLIAYIFGFMMVGIYQFNLQIFIALCTLPGVLGTYLLSEESSGVGHKKISYLAVIASIGLVIVVFILAPILVPIFYPKYTDGISSLQIMAITIVPQSIGAVFGSKLLAKESTKIGYSAFVQIGSLLLLITLLGDLYGLVGLALAVLISQTANTLFLYMLYRTSIIPKTT